MSSAPPEIRLHRGSVLWVLAQLGFQGDVSKTTFDEYIKSLRKLGLPFGKGRAANLFGRRSIYEYDHLMELALALSLRVYNTLPDAVLAEIVRHRPELSRIYRDAYRERAAGEGEVLRIRRNGCSIRLRGVFLDLQLAYRGGQLTSFGPPRLIGPAEALEIFARCEEPARVFLPLKISALADRVVTLAQRAPPSRPGPKKARGLNDSARHDGSAPTP